MNQITKETVGKLMFCYTVIFEHYQNEELKTQIEYQLEVLLNHYLPVQRFTNDGRDIVVVRESDRNEVYAIREAIEAKLPKFNETLKAHELHVSGETVLSFMYYLIEEYLEKTNNTNRLLAWKALESICEKDPAYTGVNEAPDYMGKVELAYIEMIKEVINAVKTAATYRLVKKEVKAATKELNEMVNETVHQ